MKFDVRFPLDYPVTLTREKQTKSGKKAKDEALIGKSFNLSRSGLGVRIPTKVKLKRDDQWMLSISYGDHQSNTSHEAIQMRVKVVWVDGENCGLAIVDMADAHRERYERLIAGFETLLETHTSMRQAA